MFPFWQQSQLITLETATNDQNHRQRGMDGSLTIVEWVFFVFFQEGSPIMVPAVYFLWFLVHCCPVISLVDAIRLLLVPTPINRDRLKTIITATRWAELGHLDRWVNLGEKPGDQHFCSSEPEIEMLFLICRCQRVWRSVQFEMLHWEKRNWLTF